MQLSISSLRNKEYREQKEKDKEWALNIKNRDAWRCMICGDAFHPNAHHIIPRENKEYRYELDNGITLCTKHHKFSRVLSAHNNPFAFFLWLRRFHHNFFSVAIERTNILLKRDEIVLDGV